MLAIIACKRKRLPTWLLLPPAITTLTTKPPASRPSVHGCCISPSRAASFPLREAWYLSHSARSLSICCLSSYFHVIRFSIFVLILGVGRLPLLHPVNREAVTRTHFMLFLCVLYFLFSHSSIFRERESSETILLFSDSGGSEVEPCEDGARPVTGSLFIGPRSLFFLLAPGVNPKN